MLEDADISYIAARYSLLEVEEQPLLSGGVGDGNCSEERDGKEEFGGDEDGDGKVIEEECSDPASGEQHPSAGAGRRQNTVKASLPNTVQNRGGIALLLGPTSGGTAAAAELPFGTGASSQNTLIGPNATQQTDRVSSTHTGI